MHFIEHFTNLCAPAISQHQMADGKGYTWVGQVTVLVVVAWWQDCSTVVQLVGFINHKLWELQLETKTNYHDQCKVLTKIVFAQTILIF